MNGKSKLQYQRDNRINHVGTDRIGGLHLFCLHQKQAKDKCGIRDGGFTDQSMPYLRCIGTFKGFQLERVEKSITTYGGVCWAVSDRLDGQEVFKNIRHCS